MATKKQKREAARIKGERRREAERKVGLDALKRDLERRAGNAEDSDG